MECGWWNRDDALGTGVIDSETDQHNSDSQGPAGLRGLVVPVEVLHVVAADRVNVTLIGDGGRKTGDLTVQLPVSGATVMRRCDPPLLALHLYDPSAADGHTSKQPGPCPEARAFSQRLLRRAEQTLIHIPLPADRRWRRWIDAMVTGSVVRGELWVLEGFVPRWSRVSDHLVRAGWATRRDMES